MLVARYAAGGDIHYGILRGEMLYRLPGGPFDGLETTGATDRLANARLLTPIPEPRVFAVGMNYVGHIAEAGAARPEVPLVFMMPGTAVIGPEDAIVLPREAQMVHHECELAVIIGRRVRRVAGAAARDAVFGYSCANDVSERVVQAREMASGALLIGKGYDTFCPIGPVIATGLDPDDLAIEARVNGDIRQSGHTGDLLFDVATLVSYLSQAITLLPGDVILTGTPSGVGPLMPGDRCEISITGIGTLSNPVIGEP